MAQLRRRLALDIQFKEAYDAAAEAVTDTLEAAAIDRAYNGVEEREWEEPDGTKVRKHHDFRYLDKCLRAKRRLDDPSVVAADSSGARGFPGSVLQVNISCSGVTATVKDVTKDLPSADIQPQLNKPEQVMLRLEGENDER